MKSIFLSLLLVSFSALSAEMRVLTPFKTLDADLAIGSKIELTFKASNKNLTGIFLGRLEDNLDYGDEILFLNDKTNQVEMVDTDSVVSKDKLQTVMSPFDQAGETCAAYAMFHYWGQTNEYGHRGNGVITDSFANERSRIKVLEEAITRYYMGRGEGNLALAMKKFGEKFGFKCKENIFYKTKAAIDYVFERTKKGKPVLMEFYLGPDMVESEIKFTDYETNVVLDDRLWIPRKVGERKTSGHAIVAIAAFEYKGKKKVLVLDSNWTEPRIWDLEDYLGGKTAIGEMLFHGCD